MSSLAPPPAASTPRPWTWRHVLLATIALADVAYAMLIVAGVSFGNDDRLLPPQVSQIVVGALATTTVIASFLLICARLVDRVETVVVILGGIAGQIANDLAQLHTLARVLRGEAAHIQAQLDRTSSNGEATVPLATTIYRNGRTYGSAPVPNGRIRALAEEQENLAGTVTEMAAELAKMRLLTEQMQSGGTGEAVDRLAAAVLTRVDERIDARLQDIEALATNEQHLNGRTNVVGLPRAR